MSPSAPLSRVGHRGGRRRVDGGAADQHRAGAGEHHPGHHHSELLEQLQSAHNQTLEHQHLALHDIHRITGQDRLFDTVFVYENYPTGTAEPVVATELAITDVKNRDSYHYPLTVQAVPGPELNLRVQFRTDIFDVATIEALIERFKQILDAMAADPTRPLATSALRGAIGRRPCGVCIRRSRHR